MRQDNRSTGPGNWQPRFSINTMLMVTFVFSVMATAGSYLVRSLSQGGRPAHLVFIMFTLSAPTLMMIVVSVVRLCITRLGIGRKR
jgi:hypothetical protein